jgi:hypothetical protein
MTLPLGYYTGFTPGDTSLLAKIQDTYGAQLQGLNKAEKLCLITLISIDLSILASIETPYRNEIYDLASQVRNQLPISDREGLLECLIAGVRYQ